MQHISLLIWNVFMWVYRIYEVPAYQTVEIVVGLNELDYYMSRILFCLFTNHFIYIDILF
jgi:hypothetical protein